MLTLEASLRLVGKSPERAVKHLEWLCDTKDPSRYNFVAAIHTIACSRPSFPTEPNGIAQWMPFGLPFVLLDIALDASEHPNKKSSEEIKVRSLFSPPQTVVRRVL